MQVGGQDGGKVLRFGWVGIGLFCDNLFNISIEIGIINDSLKLLFSALSSENMTQVCDNIKQYLDSPKSAGGAGCSPGQYHGGSYNG